MEQSLQANLLFELYNQPSHTAKGGMKGSDELSVSTDTVCHYMRCPLDSKLIFQNKIHKYQ